MSKLFKKYQLLKEKDKDKLYLFENGIFYLFLNEDADVVSKSLGLKITALGEVTYKCGFPKNSFEKYTNILKELNLDYQLVDSTEIFSDRDVIKYLKTIDITKITDEQAKEILVKIMSCLNGK